MTTTPTPHVNGEIPESPLASAVRLLAEALHIPEWPCDHRQYDPPQCARAAASILAHPALADTLLRGLGAGVGEVGRLSEAATPGRWVAHHPPGDAWLGSPFDGSVSAYRATGSMRGETIVAKGMDDPDADFVAALVNWFRATTPSARPGPTDGPSQRGEWE